MRCSRRPSTGTTRAGSWRSSFRASLRPSLRSARPGSLRGRRQARAWPGRSSTPGYRSTYATCCRRYACRRSCCTWTATGSCRSRQVNSWRKAFPGPASSSTRAMTMPSGSETSTSPLTRSSGSSPARSIEADRPRAGERPVHRHRRLDHACGRARRPRLARSARQRRARGPHRLRARRAGGQAHRRRSAVGVRRTGDGDALRRGAERGRLRTRHPAAQRHPHRRVRGDRRGPRRARRPHRRSRRRVRRAGQITSCPPPSRSSLSARTCSSQTAASTSSKASPARGISTPSASSARRSHSSTGRPGTCGARTASPSRSRAGCRVRCAWPGHWRRAAGLRGVEDAPSPPAYR